MAAMEAICSAVSSRDTFRFFTGQNLVQSGDRRAFLERLTYLAEIGRRCRSLIEKQ